MTCLTKLLTASVVVAASLLGGCSDNAIGTASANAPAPARVVQKAAQQKTGRPLRERLASLALDDARLGEIRGGMDAGSGVVLNFAFQQATFVNHSLAETVVVPTLTVMPTQATALAGSSLGVLGGVTNSLNATMTPSVTSAAVIANGTVQTQVSVSSTVLQALVNSGLASVVGTGNGGVTSVLVNAQNNALVQQETTLNIGVSGLSKLLQQSVPSTVLNQLIGARALR